MTKMFTVPGNNRFAETPAFIQDKVVRADANPVRAGFQGFFGRSARATWLSTLGNPFISVVHINGIEPQTIVDKMNHASIYGPLSNFGYHARVSSQNRSLIEIVNLNTKEIENNVLVTCEKRDLPKKFWHNSGVEVLIDRTENYKFTELLKHIENGGAKKVVVKNSGRKVPPYVLPLEVPKGNEKVLSTLSCMANCMALPIEAVHDKFEIKNGFVNVIHGYMAEQNLVDNARDDGIYSRAAAINIIPMNINDAGSMGRIIPGLKSKLTGIYWTVPVPTGSTVSMSLNLKKSATPDDIREVMQEHAGNRFYQFMEYANRSVVSSDVIGSTFSSIFDGENVVVLSKNSRSKGGKQVILLAWCDNLVGYSARTRDLAILAGQDL